MIGKDEEEFARIFTIRSDAHLQAVCDLYGKKHGQSLEHVIKKKFSGLSEQFMLATLRTIDDRGNYFADLFEKSMAGLGTNEDMLIRLVLRCRGTKTMAMAQAAYLKKHGKSLEHRIKGETSGDFEKLLVALVAQPVSDSVYTNAPQIVYE